jgi:hypothetical protein
MLRVRLVVIRSAGVTRALIAAGGFRGGEVDLHGVDAVADPLRRATVPRAIAAEDGVEDDVAA